MHTGTRSVDRIWILVDHTGMPADALDGFPRGQLTREKALHASADEEGLFVLQVQACQYAKVVRGPITHTCMVQFDVPLSMYIFEEYRQIRDGDEAEWEDGGYVKMGM